MRGFCPTSKRFKHTSGVFFIFFCLICNKKQVTHSLNDNFSDNTYVYLRRKWKFQIVISRDPCDEYSFNETKIWKIDEVLLKHLICALLNFNNRKHVRWRWFNHHPLTSAAQRNNFFFFAPLQTFRNSTLQLSELSVLPLWSLAVSLWRCCWQVTVPPPNPLPSWLPPALIAGLGRSRWVAVALVVVIKHHWFNERGV